MPLRLGAFVHRRLIAPGALARLSDAGDPGVGGGLLPGAPGIGDPYYPAYGNGGYDVSHYDLRLKYQPATDQLEGTATLLASTTAGPVPLQPGLPAGRQRGPGQRRQGVVRRPRASTSWRSPRPSRCPSGPPPRGHGPCRPGHPGGRRSAGRPCGRRTRGTGRCSRRRTTGPGAVVWRCEHRPVPRVRRPHGRQPTPPCRNLSVA